MATESIWTVIACDEALDRQRELVDTGSFAEAKKIENDLKFVAEKCRSLIGEKGGTLHISTLDRQVLETPVTVAEEMPNIVEGFKQLFGNRMGVGMGMNLTEAAKAAWVSMHTNNIEMYDPSDEKFAIDIVTKSSEDLDFTLPPNVFDPVHPKSPEPDAEADSRQLKYKPALTAEESMQAETALLQAIVEQLGGGEQAQQQQQQMMQQMQQQAQPRNLAEALNGEQIPGQEGQQEGEQEGESAEGSGEGESSDGEETDAGQQDEKDHARLGNLLAMFNEKIPQLMGLAETNPDAFKQVISLVHKVVDMAKKNKTAKAERLDYTNQLSKAISQATGMPRGAPIGTVHKRKKKVMLNGKAVWRSVVSGQVKDSQGNAISVRSSNANANGDADDLGKKQKEDAAHE